MDADKLMSMQKERLVKLYKAQINWNKSPKNRITRGYVETRLESLEKLWKQFPDIYWKILTSVEPEQCSKIEYFTQDTCDTFEETFSYYKGCLKDALREIESTCSHQPT
ncbi:unnamed protein product [Arctia plantaginis]|uniref:Uncharacterized protein n=1 Tax=Arctia plantaginis TaxID=874455 RepID=A0A8S1AIF7_ARCPL|nr:unnamed protein product [Arctia plantaginis]